MTDFLAVLLL